MLGLRQGEALALRWSDLDLDGQHPVMVVDRSLSRHTGKGLVYGDTKTSQRRDLPLPLDLVNLLKRHRREQREQFLSLGVQWSEHTPVFAALRKGSARPIDPANDRKRWLKALARAEEPHVRLHDARHTAATIMLMEGVDMYSVSKALGHSSIQTTIDTYGHLPSASLRSAFEASSKALTRPRVAKG
jgi:integrase